MEFGRNVSVVTPSTDLEKWEAVGPVRTIRRETSSWDQARNDWGSPEGREEADFSTAGRVVEERSYSPDGSVGHTVWKYDGAGRIVEVRRWSSAWSEVWRVEYDSHGQPLRTLEVAPDGTERVAETWGRDETGRRAKVQFLPLVAIEPPDKYADGETMLGLASVPKAVTSTWVYDGDRLVEVRYHDATHTLLLTVTLTGDQNGRLELEEWRFFGLFEAGAELDDKLGSAPEEEQQKVKELLNYALDDGRFITNSYERDGKGRVLTSVRRVGTLDETRSTYAYDANGNLVESVEESRTSNLELDDAGSVASREGTPTSRRFRFDYVYDGHGNWVERLSDMQGSAEGWKSIERRTFTYYTA
jgi:hypothetical protein